MNQAQHPGLRKRVLINTVSNYGKMLIGIFVTVFLTRILFLGLSREEYGFWALLWSIFGYSLLLDFGFGTAVQKHTSECSVTRDWDKFNRVVSTVFFNYLLFAVLIFLFALFLSSRIGSFFSIAEENLVYFRSVFVLFGLGSALCFPFGFFAEILRGLQKMHTRNIIQVSFIVLNFVGMAIMIHLKLNLWGMVFVALGSNLASSLTMMVVVHRYIPAFHLSIKHYDVKLLRSVMGFSLFAYLITFTNIIIQKTDQLVISIFGSVAMVAVYQVSIRLAETFNRFSAQFLDNLGPITATLFTAGDKPKMTEMMLQSNRLMGIISSLILVPILMYVKPLLSIWLNLDHTAGAICAIILLISMYILLFFRSPSVAVMLMADEHKVLALVAVIEAIANLVLSIGLIHLIPRMIAFQSIPDAAMIGVAIGTLIPNLLLAFIFNVPKACRFAGITIGHYFKEVVNRTLVVTILSLAFAFILYSLLYPSSLLLVLAYSALSVLVYLLLTFFIGLRPDERCHLIGLLKGTHSL